MGRRVSKEGGLATFQNAKGWRAAGRRTLRVDSEYRYQPCGRENGEKIEARE